MAVRHTQPDGVSGAADAPVSGRYQPPTVLVLGTLAALTLGGDAAGVPDGFGQSGDSGFTGSI